MKNKRGGTRTSTTKTPKCDNSRIHRVCIIYSITIYNYMHVSSHICPTTPCITSLTAYIGVLSGVNDRPLYVQLVFHLSSPRNEHISTCPLEGPGLRCAARYVSTSRPGGRGGRGTPSSVGRLLGRSGGFGSSMGCDENDSP